MRVSARNVFEGSVSRLTPGPVNSEIELTTAGGDRIVAVITSDSVKTLQLVPGKPALAFVKAPWVMLMTEDTATRFSARNRLRGVISALVKGAISSEVSLRLPSGSEVHAVVTNEAVAELGLAPGRPACALIKASDVILGVPA